MPVIRELGALPYARFLRPFEGELEVGGDYTEMHFEGGDLDHEDGGGSRIVESALTGLTLTGVKLDRARLDDVWISKSRWIGGSWSDASLFNVTILDGALAGVQAYGGIWRKVVVEGCKVDSLNLRAAKLRDVEFRDCELTEVDFGGAELNNVTFPGSVLRRARFSKVTVKTVDFRGARELDVVEGWDALRGAVINSGQLAEAAPALAQTLGIVVKDR
ncbi:pentapeptide repeat-containing protein [Actinoplanes sp. NPDC051851]|uniref:pentapeptide repeat-containing protein n=1 Tax=Actinoplanes sp. NPDC051851 TaxID=3154753 RepID=UPI00343357DB